MVKLNELIRRLQFDENIIKPVEWGWLEDKEIFYCIFYLKDKQQFQVKLYRYDNKQDSISALLYLMKICKHKKAAHLYLEMMQLEKPYERQ